MAVVLILMTFGLSFPVEIAAQPGPDPVRTIENYYLTGRLDRAELEALRILNKHTGLTDYQRAELYRILGFAAVARDDTELAMQYFQSALQHNPNLRLDRNLTSPKILSVFDEARIDFSQVRILDRETLVSELKSYRLRVEGGQRSLLLPGLGQLYKGHTIRGYTLIGLTGISVVGLAYAQVRVMDSEDRYNRSETVDQADENFEEFRQFWRMRSGFGITLSTLWVIGALDAFLTPPSVDAYRRISIEVATHPGTGTPMASLSFQF